MDYLSSNGPLAAKIDVDDIPLSVRCQSDFQRFEDLDDLPLVHRIPRKRKSSKKRILQKQKLYKLKQYYLSDDVKFSLLEDTLASFRCDLAYFCSFSHYVRQDISVSLRLGSTALDIGSSFRIQPPMCGGVNKSCSFCIRTLMNVGTSLTLRYTNSRTFVRLSIEQCSGEPLASAFGFRYRRFDGDGVNKRLTIFVKKAPTVHLPFGTMTPSSVLVFVGYATEEHVRQLNSKFNCTLFSLWNASHPQSNSVVLTNDFRMFRTYAGIKVALIPDSILYLRRYFRFFNRRPSYAYSDMVVNLEHSWKVFSDVNIIECLSVVSLSDFTHPKDSSP